MDDRPIACTLDPERMARRAEEIRALCRDGLIGVTLRFRPDPEIRARVDAIVAAESECCSFMDFELGAGDDGALVVTATGLSPLFSGIQPVWPSSCSSR